MGQITWRASDDLVDRVRSAAEAENRSVNEFLTRLAEAATNPDHAGDEWARTRERLARAGLLVEPGPPRKRPDPALLEEARREAGKGIPLSDIVSENRGPV